MNGTIKIYILLFALVISLIVFVDMNTPRPIDWTPSYDITKKTPLGLYVFDKEFSEIEDYNIEKIRVTPYEYFDPLYDHDSLVNTYEVQGSVLIISPRPVLDEESALELLYFASHGNSVFLSMNNFPEPFLDSLGVSTNYNYGPKRETKHWLANPKFAAERYDLKEGVNYLVFDSIRNPKATILGFQEGTNDIDESEEPQVNFIRVPWYDGFVYLHNQPAAFSNFHMLKDNHHEYAEKLISYIPSGNVYWSVKDQDGTVYSSSPLRYFFSQPALRAAWFIFLIGMVVFLAFNAKRRQRIVPVITPLENTTVDFAKTIGNLYLQEGDHGNLIEKKIIFFLEKVRQEYLMDTSQLDENFIKRLHSKTGKDLMDIQKLVYLIKHHRRNLYTSVESDLIEINNAIEKVLN